MLQGLSDCLLAAKFYMDAQKHQKATGICSRVQAYLYMMDMLNSVQRPHMYKWQKKGYFGENANY